MWLPRSVLERGERATLTSQLLHVPLHFDTLVSGQPDKATSTTINKKNKRFEQYWGYRVSKVLQMTELVFLLKMSAKLSVIETSSLIGGTDLLP